MHVVDGSRRSIQDEYVSTRSLVVLSALLTLTSVAQADRLVLKGGAILEGDVVEQGDKVVVTVESGQLSFSRREVERVERAESEQARFTQRLASIKPGDVSALMKFADQLRDRDQHAREREVLRKVLEVDANHEGARIRLGYVRTAAGWLTADEQKRQSGLVRHEGQWMTPAQKLELERLAADTRTANLEREKAELDVAAKRADAAAKQAELSRAQLEADALARARVARERELENMPTYFFPAYAPVACQGRHCPQLTPPSQGQVRPFINGARHPSDTSFSMPGVRDPNSYF